MDTEPRIASLHCYPIKSCRGVRLEAATIEARGFALDRRFMVVDGAGRFRTQRRDAALARVAVEVTDTHLQLHADGAGDVSIELASAGDGARRAVNVWRHTGEYPDQGDEVAAFFAEVVGAPSRLVYMPDDATRRPNPKFGGKADDRVGFADAYPFLLTSTSSLAALQAEMSEPVPMERFRPNIVVEAALAWAEDAWGSIDVAGARFNVAKPCGRCVITTTDQRSGTRHVEPLPTLTRLRRVGRSVNFGTYLLPRTIGATVRVGAPVVAAGRELD
ncbi:MAG: N-terminal beta barrel domain family [Thermoleophilia bacterium]|nr:N-terminal beta barrel domain family [Thermoleophilia bacterium]